MLCPQCENHLKTALAACESCGWVIMHTPATNNVLGRTLHEKYQVLRRLSAGSYAAVYEADSPRGKIALKIFYPNERQRAEIIARQHREIAAASRVTHPCAVKVYEHGETEDGFLWLAMEMLSGETLDARLLRGQTFSEQELISLLAPLCEVLQEAHEKGIVHRDVKPANVMLTKDFQGKIVPRLLDFGMASVGEPEEADSETTSGTPRYMAPELWQGLSNSSAQSDIYALGVLAYQCLSGRLPVEAETPLAWIRVHQQKTPLDLAAAMSPARPSPELHQAIMRALSKDPKDRQRRATQFLAEVSGQAEQLLTTELTNRIVTPEEWFHEKALNAAKNGLPVPNLPTSQKTIEDPRFIEGEPPDVEVAEPAPPKKQWKAGTIAFGLSLILMGGFALLSTSRPKVSAQPHPAASAPASAPSKAPSPASKPAAPASEPTSQPTSAKLP